MVLTFKDGFFKGKRRKGKKETDYREKREKEGKKEKNQLTLDIEIG